MIRVLGLDTATLTTGAVIIQSRKRGSMMEFAARIKCSNKDPIEKRMWDMGQKVLKLALDEKPDLIMVESVVFSGRPKWPKAIGQSMSAMYVVLGALTQQDAPVRQLTAKEARKPIGAKNKDDTRRVITAAFNDDLFRLGYTKGLLKAHEDVADAAIQAFVGMNRFRDVALEYRARREGQDA